MTEKKPALGLNSADGAIAYLLLRIIVGVNYFNHGFVRIGSMDGFARAMVERFKDTFLPEPIVYLTGLAVTPVEFVVGILITIGWLTRSALIATLGLMVILMYGVTLLQDWGTAASQLVYDLILFVLLAGLGYNIYSVDYRLGGGQKKPGRSGDSAIAPFRHGRHTPSPNP
ncbi:MAG: DoxX family protein [Oscillatoriales cyanobacterium SM2_2_1]|nr:DoxX family protein [Oscillatoriales cyanobacterium SM2_2_1]